MFEKYDIPSVEEMNFEVEAITVPVVVQEYTENYQGSSRDEEYFEEELVSTETESITCPLEFIYKNSDPSEEYTGSDAISFLESTIIEQVEIKDPETAEIVVDGGDVYIGTYDASDLDEYR